jgi:3-oxoacyl-[acyl-carrier protein] reductase
MIDLEGKKTMITGGSRGIGRATAILFAKAGSDVALNYLTREKEADDVKEEIQKIGRECLVFQADISVKDDIEGMVRGVIDKWGQIDILVNNAGIWTYGEMGAITEEIWAETIKINLDGVFYVCNAVTPFMKEQKRGWIINVSSTAAVRGEAFHSHYAASKGAIISMTKSLAVELAAYSDFRKKVQASIPLKRIPPPEDIAGPIVFLASDMARHITGEVLNVNGGSVLCA